MAFPLNTGSIVYGTDFNTVQATVQQVLGSGTPFGPGTGSPTYGYNQTLQSTSSAVSSVITESQIQRLANDVNTIATHQTNANFTGYATVYANTGTAVSATKMNVLYNAINTYSTNRLTVHPSQLTSNATTYTRTTNWYSAPSGLTQTNTIVFASNAAAQYFFNQGGSISFSGAFPGTTATAHDNSWTSTLSRFNYSISTATASNSSINFNSLTSTPTTYYTDADTSLYGTTANPTNQGDPTITVDVSYTAPNITYTVSYRDPYTYSGAVTTPDTGGANTTLVVTRFTSSGAVTGTSPTFGTATKNDFV